MNLANATASVIEAIAVLLIVVSVIAVIIAIVIICIIKRNRRKGGPKGNGEADNTHHYYSLATENAVPKPAGIQGDNKNDMIVYDQVEGGGLNGTDTYEDPDVGVKVHNKVINAKTSGNGKQNEKMNDPSALYTEPNKARKAKEELYDNHDEVDPEELYTQPAKKKKIKKPPLYASRRKGDDPEALYTAVDKDKKRKN